MSLRTRMQALFVGLAAVMVAANVSAHHSTAMFAWGMERTLHGTVTQWEWTQPHSFIWVNVPGSAGGMQKFGLEGMSPSWLGRRGWNNKTLTAGDKVTITYYPLRDGRPGGFFIRVTLPDGKVKEALPGPPSGTATRTPTSSSPPSSSQTK